jgi:hypothetical protein
MKPKWIKETNYYDKDGKLVSTKFYCRECKWKYCVIELPKGKTNYRCIGEEK